MPDYVSLTDWAEDAYVSLKDAADGSGYLMEPWSFPRAGDALIADAVEEYTDTQGLGRAARVPGRQLPGRRATSGCWAPTTSPTPLDLLSRVTAAGLDARRRRSRGSSPQGLFSTYVDATRRLILVGTRRPIPLREFVGARDGDDFYLDLPTRGRGHVPADPSHRHVRDAHRAEAELGGCFRCWSGSPALAYQLLQTKSPYSLGERTTPTASRVDLQGRLASRCCARSPLEHRRTLRP